MYVYAYAYVCVLMHYMCADAECVADCDADCVAGSDVIRSSVLKKSKEVKNRFLTYWSLFNIHRKYSSPCFETTATNTNKFFNSIISMNETKLKRN